MKKYDMIADVFRGNCVCGKWLVIFPTYTKEKPLTCHGMCHSYPVAGVHGCGRRYYVIDRGNNDLELVKEEPNGS